MEAHKAESSSFGICLSGGAGISSVDCVVLDSASAGAVASCSFAEDAILGSFCISFSFQFVSGFLERPLI